LSWAADRLRKGGLVVLDNAFLFGDLAKPSSGSAALTAMQAAHEMLARGDRFRATVLPTGEGLAVGIRL
jgi:caffeoyl-CoA O-methyltransferase